MWRYVLMVVDRLTELVFYILTESMSAMEAAEKIYVHVFWFCGLPDSIISDQGPSFTSVV
jgi:hypothetical protein